MTDGLHYSLHEKGFEIAAPKALVDSATSRWGAMFDETREPQDSRVLERIYRDDTVTLDFDLTAMSAKYDNSLQRNQADRILDVILQMDAVALEEGLNDRRIRTSLSEYWSGDRFIVTFERPLGSDEEVAYTALGALRTYGGMTGMYKANSNHGAKATYSLEHGIALTSVDDDSRSDGSELTTFMSSDYKRTARFLEAVDVAMYPDPRARLVNILGILSVVPAQSYFIETADTVNELSPDGWRRLREETELRNLVDELSVIVGNYGEQNDELYKEEIHWHSRDGKYQIIFEEEQGDLHQAGRFIPASVSAYFLEMDGTTEKNCIEVRFAYQADGVFGRLDDDSDIKVRAERITRDDDYVATRVSRPADKALAARVGAIVDALTDEIESGRAEKRMLQTPNGWREPTYLGSLDSLAEGLTAQLFAQYCA